MSFFEFFRRFFFDFFPFSPKNRRGNFFFAAYSPKNDVFWGIFFWPVRAAGHFLKKGFFFIEMAVSPSTRGGFASRMVLHANPHRIMA